MTGVQTCALPISLTDRDVAHVPAVLDRSPRQPVDFGCHKLRVSLEDGIAGDSLGSGYDHGRTPALTSLSFQEGVLFSSSITKRYIAYRRTRGPPLSVAQAFIPPSTVRFAPVMYEDSGPATNATIAAISSTCP